MSILIATDGNLDPGKAADAARQLGGPVRVLTVVEIPRTMLAELRQVYGERPTPQIDRDIEYVGANPIPPSVSTSWPGDDAMLSRYIESQKRSRTSAVSEALIAAGLDAEIEAIEGEDAVSAIVEACKRHDVRYLIVGTHGRGRFEGLLGSTSTKLVRRAPCSVLVIR